MLEVARAIPLSVRWPSERLQLLGGLYGDHGKMRAAWPCSEPGGLGLRLDSSTSHTVLQSNRYRGRCSSLCRHHAA